MSKAQIRIQVPAEVYGEFVAAGMDYRKTNATRNALARAAIAFLRAALETARPTDGSGCVGCKCAHPGESGPLPEGEPA